MGTVKRAIMKGGDVDNVDHQAMDTWIHGQHTWKSNDI